VPPLRGAEELASEKRPLRVSHLPSADVGDRRNDLCGNAEAAAALVPSNLVPNSSRRGANALTVQRLLQIPNYQTSWTWLHKLRRAMGRQDLLQGTVEVDTAGLWGLAEFGKPQRNIVIAAEVEGTHIGRVRMRPVRNGLPDYLHAFVEECVASGSTIRTDNWHGYVGLAQKGYQHETPPAQTLIP
jgi:hypothetical protein